MPKPILTAGGIALLVAILFVAACSTKPASSGDLDRRTGCSSVVAERGMIGAQVVMGVRAIDCRRPDGQLLGRDVAVDRVAKAVWQSIHLPVDAVHIGVSDTGASPVDAPTTISRSDLTERFGRGPSGVVWPVRERPDERIWVVLPVAYLATGAAMLLLLRRLRSAGLVVVLLRR
jgi:hypothetical protein